MRNKLLLVVMLFMTFATAVFASDQYRRHRYNHFKGLSTNEQSIVFVGNSITDMGNWPEAFGNDPRIVSRGVSGGYSWEVRDNVYNWIIGHPAKVFIKIGTNDLNVAQGSPEGIAENIDKTLAICLEESPNTKVYIQSIIPCSNGSRSDEKIRRSNQLLQEVCQKYPNAEYFDLYQYMGDVRNGWPLGCADKLHLTGAGYATWAHAIESLVEINSTYPSGTDARTMQKNFGSTNVHGGRVANFSIEPTLAGDIIVIGDGMAQSMEWHELLKGATTVKNHATGWEVGSCDNTITANIIDATLGENGSVTRQTPKAIILYACSGSFDAATYENYITKINGYSSDIQVYCLGLQPKASNYATNNTTIAGICDKYANAHYIDIATALAPHVNDADYFTEGLPYYMSYTTIAQQIAQQAPELGLTAITTAEAQRNYTVATAAQLLYTQQAGNSIGQCPQDKIAAVKAALQTLRTANGDAIDAATTALNAAIDALKASVIVPTSENIVGRTFQISTPNRGSYYLVSEGPGAFVRGYSNASTTQYASTRWTLSVANGGSYNIQNNGDHSYLDPASLSNTSDLKTVAAAPATGWTIAPADATGTFVIKTADGKFLNMRGNSEGNTICNWAQGGTTDLGNQFAFTDVTDIEEQVKEVYTEDANVTVNTTNGTGVGTGWTKQWVSNDKLVTINVAANNMQANNGNIDFRSGQAKTATYTITAAEGYYVSGYSFITTGANSITITGNGSSATASTTGTPFSADVAEGTAASFTVVDNANSQNVLSNFHVRLTPVGAQPSTNIDGTAIEEQIEGTAVTLSFNAGTLSGGSSSWRNTWTSSSTPAVKVEAYNTTNLVGNLPGDQSAADGFIVYTGNRNASGATIQTPPFTSTLRISAPTGYYITGYSFGLTSHDLTATGVTVTTPKGNHTVNNSSAAQSESYTFSGTEQTSFDFTLVGENKGVKFTDFKVYIKEEPTVPVADAYTVDKANGRWTATNNNGSWASVWKSNDDKLTFTANANNMQWAQGDDNHIDARSGQNKSATYTLASADPEYVIESYSFKAKALTSTQTWRQGSNTYTVTTGGTTTIADTDVDEQSVQFTLTDADNSGTVLTEFTVTLKKVELDPTIVEPEKVTVLDNAHSSIPYRIPAIASTKDGVLVVAADYRFTKADIGGGRLDLHIRRSFDYGKTWEDRIIMPENMIGNGRLDNDAAGFGDPCIVADRESSKMMILSCAGYPGFFQCTRNQHQRCARWYSEDNGETWTGPEFIDNTFVFEPLDGTSFGPAQGMFFGSGKIHQSRYVKVKDYYRLYASNSVRNSGGTIRNYVMYSDDFGQTWNFLGGVDAPAVGSGGDEPKVEELPDGSVLFSGRRNSAGGRNFNIFRFTNAEKAEGQWLGNAVSSGSVNGITNDNACNGEIQLVPVVRKKDGAKMWLALQSVPFNGRNNVGIFYKPLASEADYATPTAIASNWEGKHQCSWTTSAYSTMVLQGDKNIGFVYEENGPSNGGYDIQYKNYSIEVITNGKYTFDPDYEMADVVLPLQAAIVTPAASTVEKVETITVSYNKSLTLKQPNVALAEGVEATASVSDNVLTLTLTRAIVAGGKHSLTIPAGIVGDKDGQENKPVSLTYRIIGEEQPLGAQVTSLEGITCGKTYALYNPASHGYAIYAPQHSTSTMWAGEMQDMDANHKVSNTTYSEDVNHADPNNAWMIVNFKGEYYLYNVGAEKFVTVARPTSLGEAKPIKITPLSNGGFAFNTNGGNQDFMCASPQLGEPVAIWTSSDAGSCWQIYENPNVEADFATCISHIVPLGTLIDYVLERRSDEAPAVFDINDDEQIGISDVTTLIRLLLEAEEQKK